MKLIICTFFLFILSFQGYTQTDLTLSNTKSLDSLYIENSITNDSITTDSISTLGIKSEHWDTKKFNPYKDELIKFPIQIKFDDSLYKSPVFGNMVITSRYGWRNRRAHKGIDIDLITGDDVVSILGGVVRYVRYHAGHGKTVIVRHYNGLETIYAHLSSYAVKANDTVRPGQILGRGGATGNARGSHLHLVVNYKGIAINPEYLLDFSNSHEVRSSDIWITRRWTTPYYHSSRRKTNLELLQTEGEAIASLTKEKKIYVVKRGDTLSRISSRNNVSIRALCVANNIKTTSILKIGQKLILGI